MKQGFVVDIQINKLLSISTEGCAHELSSEIVILWTVVKPKEKGKDISFQTKLLWDFSYH